jgi:cytochrome c biogenesis factor
MLAAAFGPPIFSLIYIYTLLSSVMTRKKLAGVILIFIGILGLIITFYVIFALLFVSGFCGTAPNVCDGMNAILLR